MFTSTGPPRRNIVCTGVLRIARARRVRLALRLVAASVAVLALYAFAGVVPAYAEKLPTVTSVTPGEGPTTGGTLVTIGGTFLKNVRTVKFGSTDASGFTVNSQTSITATTPANAAGTVDVTVTIPGRSSATSAADHFEFTPTVTGVSPNTGPAVGGTPVTITGSGFAVGKSVTGFLLGEAEALGVNCPTTSQCTATMPGHPPRYPSAVDVRAIVNTTLSPETPADQFTYHGIVLQDEAGPLGVGSGANVRGTASAGVSGCEAFIFARVESADETTTDLGLSPEQFPQCELEDFSGELPFFFTVRLGVDGSATVEGPMGFSTLGCIYEGDRLNGRFEPNARLNVGLSGTFALVGKESPEDECEPTEQAFVGLGTERFEPIVEVVG